MAKRPRDTSNPNCNWKPSDQELTRLREIGGREPTMTRLISEIVSYQMKLRGGSEFVDAQAWSGVCHIIDTALMRLAAMPAENETELELKRDFLTDIVVHVPSHRHLPKMAMAALEEDIARLRPTDPFYSLDRRG